MTPVERRDEILELRRERDRLVQRLRHAERRGKEMAWERAIGELDEYGMIEASKYLQSITVTDESVTDIRSRGPAPEHSETCDSNFIGAKCDCELSDKPATVDPVREAAKRVLEAELKLRHAYAPGRPRSAYSDLEATRAYYLDKLSEALEKTEPPHAR